jgi:hypothetical protein
VRKGRESLTFSLCFLGTYLKAMVYAYYFSG